MESPHTRDLVKKVMMIAGLAACLALLSSAADIAKVVMHSEGNLAFAICAVIIALLLKLLVPGCGYFGAKQVNEQMLCCFCTCNFIGGCLSIIGIISGALFLGIGITLKHVVDNCNPAAPSIDNSSCPADSDWQKMCEQLNNVTISHNMSDMMASAVGDGVTTKQDCYDFLAGIVNPLLAIAAASILFQCCGMCLSCVSGVWGKDLHDIVKEGHFDHMDPMAHQGYH